MLHHCSGSELLSLSVQLSFVICLAPNTLWTEASIFLGSLWLQSFCLNWICGMAKDYRFAIVSIPLVYSECTFCKVVTAAISCICEEIIQMPHHVNPAILLVRIFIYLLQRFLYKHFYMFNRVLFWFSFLILLYQMN